MAMHDDLLSRWTPADTEEFIAAVRERPQLWDTTHPNYKDKIVNSQGWEELRKYFSAKVEADELKRKWKNLKDSFRKENKRRSEYLMTVGIPESTWRHYSSLEFLMEDVCYAASLKYTGGKTKPTYLEYQDTGDDCEMNEVQDKTNKTNSLPGQPTPVPSPPTSTTSQTSKATTTKRPNIIRKEFLEIEKKKLKMLEAEIEKQKTEENKQKSDDYHFLMSILPQMEKLHPIQKLRIRNKINQALMEELNMTKLESPVLVPLSRGTAQSEPDKCMEPQQPTDVLQQTNDVLQQPIVVLQQTTDVLREGEVYCKVEIEDNFL